MFWFGYTITEGTKIFLKCPYVDEQDKMNKLDILNTIFYTLQRKPETIHTIMNSVISQPVLVSLLQVYCDRSSKMRHYFETVENYVFVD